MTYHFNINQGAFLAPLKQKNMNLKNKTKAELLKIIETQEALNNALYKRIKKEEDSHRDLIRENYELNNKIDKLEDDITKEKINNIAELKMLKMILKMVQNDGFTHRQKNRVVEQSYKILDTNINEMESDLVMKVDKNLPF